jgi:uncharacterized membrane protein YoaK (UPF0700 family)
MKNFTERELLHLVIERVSQFYQIPAVSITPSFCLPKDRSVSGFTAPLVMATGKLMNISAGMSVREIVDQLMRKKEVFKSH